MREFKFRAWDSNIKKMIHQNEMSLAIFFEKISFRNIESTLGNNIELMQFTGLKDKNGKEIYEGDICKFEGAIVQSEIIYSENRFECRQFYCPFQSDPSDVFEEIKKIEVIGNIYENPELLQCD